MFSHSCSRLLRERGWTVVWQPRHLKAVLMRLQRHLNLVLAVHINRVPVGSAGSQPQATAATAAPGLKSIPHTVGGVSGTSDFFQDEMRGYRLLESDQTRETECALQTGNNTAFQSVKRALRAMFADENEVTQ